MPVGAFTGRNQEQISSLLWGGKGEPKQDAAEAGTAVPCNSGWCFALKIKHSLTPLEGLFL